MHMLQVIAVFLVALIVATVVFGLVAILLGLPPGAAGWAGLVAGVLAAWGWGRRRARAQDGRPR